MKPTATLTVRQVQIMHILKQNVYGFAEAHHLVLRSQKMRSRYGRGGIGLLRAWLLPLSKLGGDHI